MDVFSGFVAGVVVFGFGLFLYKRFTAPKAPRPDVPYVPRNADGRKKERQEP